MTRPLAEDSIAHDSAEAPVLAWLSPQDFALAQRTRGFAPWRNRREFLEERDALFVGYGMAGLTPRRQSVCFEAFLRWARLTGAPVDLDGLDEFAAQCRFRSVRPAASIIGRFGAPGDPERNRVDAAGAQCVYVRPEVFVRWRDDYMALGLFERPSLDAYAAQVVELCIAAGRRRAAVNASNGFSEAFEERE